MQGAGSNRISLDEIDDLLSPLPQRHRHVLELHYGLRNREPHTLESIGAQLQVSKERARQIEMNSVDELRRQDASLGKLAKHVRDALEAAGGVAELERLVEEVSSRLSLDILSGDRFVRLMLRVDPEIVKTQISGSVVWAIGRSSISVIPRIEALCRSMLRDAKLGLRIEEVVTRVMERLSPSRVDQSFVVGVIRASRRIRVWNNERLFDARRRSGPRLVETVNILRRAGQALHFYAITEGLNARMGTRSSPKAVRGFLERNLDVFTRVDHGTFGLREREI